VLCFQRFGFHVLQPLRATEEEESSNISDVDLVTENFEPFGIGEKTIEFRDLAKTTEDIEISDKVVEIAEVVPKALTLRPMAVLRFLAPTLILWIAPPVMSLIDTSVVGRYCGPTDLAALSPGCTLIDSSAYLFMFLATAATNLVATARADGDEKGAQRIVSEALFLALCSGMFLASIVLIAGRPLLSVIAGRQSAEVVPSALRYATVRSFAQAPVVMASVARAAALAQKDTWGPLQSVAMAFTLNAVGTVTLVRVAKLGIVGAAIGTFVADCAAAAFLLARIRRFRRNDSVLVDEKTALTERPIPLVAVPTLADLNRFVRYAAPIFFTILGKSVVYNGIGFSVGRLGSTALAAHQVLLRSFFFWTPVGDSVGMTSQVFLPGILAEERRSGVPKPGAKRLLFLVGVLAGLCAATLAGLLPSKGSGLFTTDAAVAGALGQTAPILALSVSLHAIALTCEGMLLALRDLGFLSSSYVVTTVLTAVLLLSPYRPGSLAGSWWFLALFQASRALQFAFRILLISAPRRRRNPKQ
jgi:putative MATE family efflux protein